MDPATQEPGPKHCGVFVCGTRPMWLVAARGALWPHTMLMDGPVTAMTPFHNVNCPHVGGGCLRTFLFTICLPARDFPGGMRVLSHCVPGVQLLGVRSGTH